MSSVAPVEVKVHEPRPVSIGSMVFPETNTHHRASSIDDAGQALIELESQKLIWSHLPNNEKISLLDEALHDLDGLGEAWVGASLKARGINPGGFAEGEEWFIFGAVVRLVRLLRKSLSDAVKYGHPLPFGNITTNINNQISVPAFPTSTMEKILFTNHHAETWLEPDVTQEDIFKIAPKVPGRLTLVLGAGNTGVSPCADILHFLFTESDVVLLKMNPVNDYLGPILEQGFNGLIRRGFLRIVYGGKELGSYLCEHPLVNHIHMTGSDKTFELLVFGSGDEGLQRKATNAYRLTKPITAELGCVNPLILVPGSWKEKDYQRAALMVATWLSSNAGYNCLTPRLVITQKNWTGRQSFLQALRQLLAKTPIRPAYYPGSNENRNKFLAAHPEAELYTFQGPPNDADGTIESLPIAFITNLDPDSYHDVCFTNEPFGMLISETAINADSPSDFLSKATEFVNRHVWGTLSITLMTPKQVESDKQTRQAIQKAIASLNYGTICLNIFPGFVYTTANTPWGGFPNQTYDNIQSGVGFINNPLRLNRPQKSIFYAPFQRIDPVSIRNRHLVEFCRRYVDLQFKPGIKNMLKVLWLALRA